jgi:hypothetical protein
MVNFVIFYGGGLAIKYLTNIVLLIIQALRCALYVI